jgi:hypothetical protein
MFANTKHWRKIATENFSPSRARSFNETYDHFSDAGDAGCDDRDWMQSIRLDQQRQHEHCRAAIKGQGKRVTKAKIPMSASGLFILSSLD